MSAGLSSLHFYPGPFGRMGELQAFASSGADLAFTSGMTGHDRETGRIVRSLNELPTELRDRIPSGMVIADVPETRIRAQTLVAIDHARCALEAAGSSLSRLVSLRLFLRDIRDAASAAAVVKTILGTNTPATTIIEATGPGVDPEVDVVLDAVGARLGGRFAPNYVFVPGIERLCGGFPAATVLGPYVFTTPVSAADPKTGRINVTLDALTETERSLLEVEYFSSREECLAVEQVLLWRNVRQILTAIGVPFENILHQNNWLTISMQQYAPVTKVRRQLFGLGVGRTAATSLPISGLRMPGAAFECSITGIKTGYESRGFRKEIAMEGHGVGPYYVGAVKAGPWVFAAGEVPIRADAGKPPEVVARAAELRDDLRFLNLGRVHSEYPIMGQAHYVYELIGEALGRYGCTMRDALRQTVYLVEPADYPALERIATLHFGARLPPTTLVPIRGASPFRETRLEIEVTAHASA